MSRLTIKDEQGNWGIKGIPWMRFYPGSTITLDIWDKLYGCLWKLMDYEDTGLDPDEVETLNNFTESQVDILLKDLNKDQRKHRWIPVTERLPETEDYILVSFSNFTVPLVARYEEDDEGGAFYLGDDEKSFISYGIFVNAWMPFPEPYKPECLGTAANHADQDTIAPAT